MIEAEFGFFQVQGKGAPVDAVELGQAVFCKAPEAFDAVDVVGSEGELIVAVVDPMMACVAQIDQSVVAASFTTALSRGESLVDPNMEHRLRQ